MLGGKLLSFENEIQIQQIAPTCEQEARKIKHNPAKFNLCICGLLVFNVEVFVEVPLHWLGNCITLKIYQNYKKCFGNLCVLSK